MANKIEIEIYAKKEVVLLPCPFCGADDRKEVVLRKVPSDTKIKNFLSRVECLKCGATVTSGGNTTTDEEAVERWNKRKPNVI